MPILSRKDLERISRKVLFRYLTLSDRKMDRIDPVDFAEKICGLHFAFADMSVIEDPKPVLQSGLGIFYYKQTNR